MKLRWTLLCLLAIMTASLNAKRVVEERNLEAALVEIVYKRVKVTDTLHIDTDYETDFLTLRAGKSISAFYSAKKKSNDSIMERNFDYVASMLKDNKTFSEYSGLEKEVIYKNYPAGKVTVHSRYSLSNWVYEEEWEKPIWEITDSTATIGGYECLLATSEYRGRRWFAWFTPEIPIQEGPWKLCGLPGLILEACDARKHYHFTAQAVRLNPVEEVEYFNYSDRLRTDRISSLKERRKALKVSIRDEILSSGAYGLTPRKIEKSEVIPHRNYDFEETDYPHE